MPLPSSKKDAGLGRAIQNRKVRDAQERGHSSYHTTDLLHPSAGGPGLRSVTHQGDLEEFLSTAQLADADFTAERRNITVVQTPDSLATGKSLKRRNPFLLDANQEREVLSRQEENKTRLTVPRRPPWNTRTTPDQLRRLENDSFLDWRRSLAQMTEANNFILTPFERNIEVWRQLWRVAERSHLIVQIVDARNPLRFRCEDLDRYVSQIGVRLGQDNDELTEGDDGKKNKRRSLLLINKADLLDEGQRQEWARYFAERGIEYAFFSAANATALQAARAEAEALAHLGEEAQDGDSDDYESDSDASDVGKVTTQAKAVDLGARDAKPLVGQEAAEHVLEANRAKVEQLLREEQERGPADSVDAALSTTAGQEAIQDGSTDPHKTAADPTRVLNVLELEELFMARAPALEEFATEEHGTPSKLVVGLVGYPNVGKSSTINALLGEKKVSVSSTPGKTKHFQTIQLSDNVTLCDCPGLVFPQFAMTSAELVLDGVLPIDQMREYTAPAELLAQRIPKDILEGTYGFRIETQHPEEGGSVQPTGLEVLTAYAIARGFARQGQGNPDESRAARYVFKDYVNAKLLFAHPPPDTNPDEFNAAQRAKARAALSGRRLAPPAPNGQTFVDPDAGLALNDHAPAGPTGQAPGKKTRALDAAFFGNGGSGVVQMGRKGTPGARALHGRVNNDGTVAAGQQQNNGSEFAAQQGSSRKKHFKGNRRKKERSGQGFD